MNNVTIIGTGPAGLTAAIYSARAGLQPVIYTGLQHGGQLTTTTVIENFPGFRDGITGPQLMEDMTEQAKRVGTEVIHKKIARVDLGQRPFTLWVDGEKRPIQSKTVVIATGASAKTLGLESERELMGKGLSTCATCDGFFYRDKKVVVIGGGDSAMEEAGYLANLCREVILVHRRSTFRASTIMTERIKASQKVELMTPFVAKRLLFNSEGLTGVQLENTANNEICDIKCDGLFYAIGHRPNSEMFASWIDLDEQGYIRATEHCATKVPGVFVAGDIADPVFRQAITAAGMGCQAGMQAARFIEANY